MTRKFTIPGAIERYLKEREPDLSDSSLYNQRSALRQFSQFLETNDIGGIDEIDPFLVSDFRLERQQDVSEQTVYNNMVVVRTFLKWCASRNIVDNGLPESIIVPEVSDGAKSVHIEAATAEEILSYLSKYEYATLRHALFALLWDSGIRIGAARTLNVDHLHTDENYIVLEHKPEQDLPLKNRINGERHVNLRTETVSILSDYIEARRTEATGAHGNRPLFTTDHGRAHRNTLRKQIVALTRPCYYSDECPHNREIETCEATQYNVASKCPSSVSPHPIRRSAITHWLNEGHSKELLSDRMDVSVSVLEEHYDARTREQKRELRRDMLDIE